MKVKLFYLKQFIKLSVTTIKLKAPIITVWRLMNIFKYKMHNNFIYLSQKHSYLVLTGQTTFNSES